MICSIASEFKNVSFATSFATSPKPAKSRAASFSSSFFKLSLVTIVHSVFMRRRTKSSLFTALALISSVHFSAWRYRSGSEQYWSALDATLNRCWSFPSSSTIIWDGTASKPFKTRSTSGSIAVRASLVVAQAVATFCSRSERPPFRIDSTAVMNRVQSVCVRHPFGQPCGRGFVGNSPFANAMVFSIRGIATCTASARKGLFSRFDSTTSRSQATS
mmetsp:Transcript_5507/g.13784  ORF Transcript_5507/g.13784 Transcript_5507/m.13784 type:complete len:217 (+) Transcript_5507:240-890(+)